MLTVYAFRGTCLVRRDDVPSTAQPAEAVWLDLMEPTPDEDRLVERLMGVSIPTRDEMQEIETSSRLYLEDGAAYMTATLLCQADSDRPRNTAVTFILAGKRLATVRYDAPRAFSMFETRALKPASGFADGSDVLLGPLDAIIDRLADILESVGAEVDRISTQVFNGVDGRSNREKDYGQIIRAIGRQGTTIGKIQESLVSIARLVGFLGQEMGPLGLPKIEKARLKSHGQDIRSLSDYAVTLDNKITFLLDATLGLVSLQQNTIVKIFSVLAVVFMPPTLIASIYGMNFQSMPELEWAIGYPMAIGLMFASAFGTYGVFKWRGWL
jgi:magnesium transporter